MILFFPQGTRALGPHVPEHRGALSQFRQRLSHYLAQENDGDSLGEVSRLGRHVHGGVEPLAHVRLGAPEAHPVQAEEPLRRNRPAR